MWEVFFDDSAGFFSLVNTNKRLVRGVFFNSEHEANLNADRLNSAHEYSPLECDAWNLEPLRGDLESGEIYRNTALGGVPDFNKVLNIEDLITAVCSDNVYVKSPKKSIDDELEELHYAVGGDSLVDSVSGKVMSIEHIHTLSEILKRYGK